MICVLGTAQYAWRVRSVYAILHDMHRCMTMLDIVGQWCELRYIEWW